MLSISQKIIYNLNSKPQCCGNQDHQNHNIERGRDFSPENSFKHGVRSMENCLPRTELVPKFRDVCLISNDILSDLEQTV